jgi:hypothetical protein
MRSNLTGLACALGALLALALPAAASATPSACHQPATISSTTGVTDHNFTKAPDASGSFATPLTAPTLFVGHAYQLGGRATVGFAGRRFELSAGSVFSLGCFGQVVGGPLLPSLHLQSGSIRLSGSRSHPGGIDTTEALANPVLGYSHRLTFTIRRKLNTPSELNEAGMFYDVRGFINAPLGKTTVTTDGAGYTNITPYVGSSPGTCRHAHSAQLKSTGRKNHNFAGNASYHGLHS